MATLYQKLLDKAQANKQLTQHTQKSREWLRDQATHISQGAAENVSRWELSKYAKPYVQVGHMYMYRYNPKTKDDLPYYDRFPIVFPFEKTPDGFLGINMHYLPYTLRARLMDRLYDLVSDENYDRKTHLKGLSYRLLKSASKYKYFVPCVKRYLNTHVTSRLALIHPLYWDMALFLPLEQFEKATTAQVHRDSVQRIRR